tara:strand:+ start:12305 stop:12901 length:597 start_codon:yes stop_codon:yes gene_type:complete
MIQMPILQETTIAIFAASRGPGPAVAHAAAQQGARIVAIDGNPVALSEIAGLHPVKIETLVMNGDQLENLRNLKDSWGAVPTDLVLNLLPLDPRVEITAQMRGLSALVQAMGRGVVAGKGAIVTVVERPREALSLTAQGMLGAVDHACAALGRELAARSVRVHVVTVPQGQAEMAMKTVLYLGSDAGRSVQSGRIDLG